MFCRLRQCRQILPKLNLSAILLLFLIKRAALGNMKANFHCAHLHNLSPQGTGDVPTALLGAQTASLYGWRTIRGLRQQRSCVFFCAGMNPPC